MFSTGDNHCSASDIDAQCQSLLEEEELTASTLLDAIQKLYKEKDAYIDTMKQSTGHNSIEKILELIQKASK